MTYGLSPEEKDAIGRKGAESIKRLSRESRDRCANCGGIFPLRLLDCKPERLAGPGRWYERLIPSIRMNKLIEAGIDGEDFNRMECQKCYGPGWVEGVPDFLTLREKS